MEIGEITDYLYAANKFHKNQEGQGENHKEHTQEINGTYSDFQRLMG